MRNRLGFIGAIAVTFIGGAATPVFAAPILTAPEVHAGPAAGGAALVVIGALMLVERYRKR